MTMIRHGDILLRSTAAPPPTATLDPAGPPAEATVLARGEATGHAHVLQGLGLAMTDRTDRRRPRALLQVLEPSTLRHEEHGPIEVAPGWYEVIQQRTYTPTAPVPVRD